uniref:Uncharacterized protein n=1 Tax=Siphoviridae sp. ct2vX3 TaxID=2825318 RepID=A0A8S5PZK6_9CAUD|nr:MAG TPA: hypothetical protein [Siphoviridae sp. ct2vX3]
MISNYIFNFRWINLTNIFKPRRFSQKCTRINHR